MFPLTLKPQNILVVDDHPLFRRGVVELLSRDPQMKVVAEARNSGEALTASRKHKLDLAVVDIGLEGGANGIELTKSIHAEKPNLPVLVLSMHDEAVFAERALRAGARGYVMKRESPESLLTAVRTILEGKIFISPAISNRMILSHLQSQEPASPIEKLSDRELEILQLMGEGHEVRDIAARLHLSPKTVEAHRANIKEKLQLQNARQVLRFATEWVQSQL